MVELITKSAKLAIYFALYVSIGAGLLGWVPDVLSILEGVSIPNIIPLTLSCTISTLNWLFSPALVKFALTIWFTFPLVKLGYYLSFKFASA